MSDSVATKPVAAGDTRAIVGDGSVEVVVSFPPIVMSAAEAEALRLGHVLDIGACLSELQLSVQISGREVAIGRLVVLIEDHAAVRLSHVRT